MAEKESLLALMRDRTSFEKLSEWTDKINIFDILKISRTEIRHSNMLSWMLDPNENHGLNDKFLFGIISKVSEKIEEDKAIDFLFSNFYTYRVFREWNNIDILLVSDSEKKVVVIENKIGSHEHNAGNSSISQLKKYKKTIEKNYKEYQHIFLYLTPDGGEPTEDEWLIITYVDVLEVLEKIVKTSTLQLQVEARVLINNYIDNIKKHVIMDKNLIDLCKQIYNNHRAAFDLIYEYKDDLSLQISNSYKSALESLKGKYNIEVETTDGKSYIIFRTQNLKEIFNDVNCQYYYQIEIRKTDKGVRASVKLVFHKDRNVNLNRETVNKINFFITKERVRIENDDWEWKNSLTSAQDFESVDDNKVTNELEKALNTFDNKEKSYFASFVNNKI